mgnify:CR=1 FL=1
MVGRRSSLWIILTDGLAKTALLSELILTPDEGHNDIRGRYYNPAHGGVNFSTLQPAWSHGQFNYGGGFTDNCSCISTCGCLRTKREIKGAT